MSPVPSSRPHLRVLFLGAGLLLLTHQAATADNPAARKTLNRIADADEYPLKHDKAKAEKVRAEYLAWYTERTVKAFETHGNTKAAWAPKARAALEAYAAVATQQALCNSPDGGRADAGVSLAALAVKDGCDDPLVRFLALPAPSDRKASVAQREAAYAVLGSKYPDAIKLVAAHASVKTHANMPKDDPDQPEKAKLEARYWEVFERVAALNDRYADGLLLAQAYDREAYLVAVGRPRSAAFAEINRHLVAGKASRYVRLVAEAKYLIHVAWGARGSGVAGTVTPDGARVFQEKLDEARDKLEVAWEEDKTRHQAPTDMLLVCRGLEPKRAVMEEWYARALAANPDNRPACGHKMEYLHPKWHGTDDQWLAFGWMCVRSGNWEGQFGLVPVENFSISAPILGPSYKNVEGTKRFYSNNLNWEMLQTGIEGQLSVSPDNRCVRSLYARCECIAGKWDVAHAQFEKLGPRYNRRFFPDADEYARFVEMAKNGGKID